MTDHDRPPDLDFFARVLLAFFLAFVAATLLFYGTGCASAKPPDALAATVALSNGAAGALASAKADEERAFKADLIGRLGKCPAGDAACHQVAAQEALAAHGADSDRLTGLAQLQRLIGSALILAEECRAAQQPACEADALHTVDLRMPELRAGLAALLQGVPAP